MLGLTLGAINWAYDAYAIRQGKLIVYNQPFAQGRGAMAIAADYAPAYFCSFGFCSGVVLVWIQGAARTGLLPAAPRLVGALAAACLIPPVTYMLLSRLRHGSWGLRPQHPSFRQSCDN